MAMQQDMHMSTPGKRKILGPCANILVAAHTGSWRLLYPLVDNDACVRCGICATYCPTASITVHKKPQTLDINMDYCKGCGICANECPKGAIVMLKEGEQTHGNQNV